MRAVAPVVAVIFILAPTAWASTATAGVADREADLALIRDQIDVLEGELKRFEEREETLEAKLARTELELELQQQQVAEASAARSLAEDLSAASRAEVDRLQSALSQREESLSRRVFGLYRLGRQGYVRLALSIDSGADVLSAVRMVRYLVRRDADAVSAYRVTREELSQQVARLAREEAEVAEWLEQEEVRQAALAGIRRRQAGLLEQARSERADVARRANELIDQERKLSALLDGLYGRTETPLAGQSMTSFRGVLDWPVEGRVAIGFGPRFDPRYRTQVPHNGVEIRPEGSTSEVKAVYPGEVLFAASFEGFGPTVVVHHPGRVLSLYARLSELQVSKGDVLELGDVVGLVAERLYFEIRADNRPRDPTEWLR